MYAAISEYKPGNTTADMMKHWQGQKFIQSGTIHGLGLVNYEPPWGNPVYSLKYPYELKEGHVFAIETSSVGIGDGQALKFEEMVVVTETGHEVLTRAPLEIITYPVR